MGADGMLKHKDLIEKLNTLQKVALVASVLRDEPFEQAGVPAICRADLGALAEGEGVSYQSAARAWDPALVGGMTEELACAAGEKGVRLFVTPDLKVAVDPYSAGLSEDGYLNGALGGEAVRAIHAVGGAAGLSRLSLNAEETAWLDRKEDASAIYEFVTRPFLKATEEGGCEVVFSDPKRMGGGYYHTNRNLFHDVLGGAYGDAFAVGEGESTPDAVKLLRGKVSLGGLSIPLERALRRYLRLAEYEAEGSVQRRDLEEALRDGSAVDTATLDAAADEIIDFALRLNESKLHAPASAPAQAAPATPVTPAAPAVRAENLAAEQIAEPAPAEQPAEQPAAEPVDPVPAEQPAEAAEQTAEQPAEQTTEQPAAPATSEAAPATSEAEPAKAEAEPAAAAPAAEPVSAPAPAPEIVAEPIPLISAVPAFAPPILTDEARSRMAEECIVLLKNDGLLPLAKGTKIAVLGEAYGDLSPLTERFSVVGTADGYDREEPRSDECLPVAVRATNHADAVLVFLYPDRDGRTLALPANRLALLDALKKAKKRVIALVCGDRPVDMDFDGGLSASMLVPADGPYAAAALARVLSGEVNPSGRVTRTVYSEADEYFRAYREDRDSGRMRVGSLAGYRRYVTGDEKVRYPFGYGIGYSKFLYSELKLEQDSVTFSLTNMGAYDGTEVVQVYMGAPKTSRVTPRRQLIAFRRVFLRAGEKKQITFDLPAARYATFDYRLYAENVETGLYRVYVGASVLDIRLQGKRYLKGVQREPVRESAADYFPNGDYITIEKVGQEHRVEERDSSRRAERILRLRKAAIYALPAAAILFFVLTSILILSYVLDYALISAAGQETMKWILYVAAIGVISCMPLIFGLNRKRIAIMRSVAIYAFPVLFILCFILGALLVAPGGGEWEGIALRVLSCLTVGTPVFVIVATFVERDVWRTRVGKDRWNKYYFERKHDAVVTSEPQFEEAFRAAEEARIAKAVAEAAATEEPTPADEVPQFYDKRLTYEQLLADCRQFMAERGLVADEETLRNYLGALTATQLIVVPAGGGAALCESVAEYFGKKAYIDNAEKYRRYDDIFTQWKQSGRANFPTGLSDALVKAKYESAYLHTVLIRHVDPALLETLFLPIADVLARRRTALPLPGEESVMLPPNLVIVAEIEAERALHLPVSVTEVAAVLSPVCESCEPSPKRTILQSVGAERFTAMRQAVREDYPLPEICWQNVDYLDEVCKSARIGNRLWLKLELHASVASACGASTEEALDGALAAEVLPWLGEEWKDDICGTTMPQALVEIFGEQNARLGLKAISEGEEADES